MVHVPGTCNCNQNHASTRGNNNLSPTGDKLLSGVLGGCSFVNLVIFEEIAKLPEEAVPSKNSFYKLAHGQLLKPNCDPQAQGQFFYQRLRWFDILNSSKQEFKSQYLSSVEYGWHRHGHKIKDLQWLKEWEEAADKEGIY